MIRKADKKDLAPIMDIWLKTNITTHDYIADVNWKKHFEEVKTAISNAEVYIFEDTEIKGFVGLVGHYIAGIFVKQNFQSQGIGGQLISFLQE